MASVFELMPFLKSNMCTASAVLNKLPSFSQIFTGWRRQSVVAPISDLELGFQRLFVAQVLTRVFLAGSFRCDPLC